MNLKVDPVELHSASQRLIQMAADYTTVYNRLMNAATNMGEAWKAADNLAFVDQIQGFCDDLKSMFQHLENGAKALDMQAASYETVRDGNVTGVRRLAN